LPVAATQDKGGQKMSSGQENESSDYVEHIKNSNYYKPVSCQAEGCLHWKGHQCTSKYVELDDHGICLIFFKKVAECVTVENIE
jgi:hypothetical protein